jgi:uncharacterized protein YjbI with pentapeptide repeats
MASDEHVALLKQGVAAWNEWRLKNPDTRPNLNGVNLGGADLREVNLRGADLSGANLGKANLSGANFSGASLREAYLRGAILRGADLRRASLGAANLRGAHLMDANLRWSILWEANLRGANLRGANLVEANLMEANLREAYLRGADFRGADLSLAFLSGAHLGGANLTGANLFSTVFVDTNLTDVIGLETCNHDGPSIIDHRTLERSPPLPLSFLRGVGLPDNFIALLNQAVQHYSCFISYSTKDQEFAERLHADLQNKGVRCWFAPHDLPVGAKTWDAIGKAIELHDKVLLVLSQNSVDSDWVEDEVQKALAKERDRKQLILFPVSIDDAVMKTLEPWARKLRDQRNVGDFQHWKDHDAYKRSFEHVVRDLTKSTRAEQRRSKNESPGRATTYV